MFQMERWNSCSFHLSKRARKKWVNVALFLALCYSNALLCVMSLASPFFFISPFEVNCCRFPEMRRAYCCCMCFVACAFFPSGTLLPGCSGRRYLSCLLWVVCFLASPFFFFRMFMYSSTLCLKKDVPPWSLGLLLLPGDLEREILNFPSFLTLVSLFNSSRSTQQNNNTANTSSTHPLHGVIRLLLYY